MKRFEKTQLNGTDHIFVERTATICRVLLSPIMIWYRLYLWIWDGTIYESLYNK